MALNTPIAAIKRRINPETWQHGWSVGHNKRGRWYLSAHKQRKGPKLEFEWHNYPKHTDTLYICVGGKSENGWSLTCWPPEQGRLADLLRKIPAKVWRKY